MPVEQWLAFVAALQHHLSVVAGDAEAHTLRGGRHDQCLVAGLELADDPCRGLGRGGRRGRRGVVGIRSAWSGATRQDARAQGQRPPSHAQSMGRVRAGVQGRRDALHSSPGRTGLQRAVTAAHRQQWSGLARAVFEGDAQSPAGSRHHHAPLLHGDRAALRAERAVDGATDGLRQGRVPQGVAGL